jgi:ZIP family zinc transporter
MRSAADAAMTRETLLVFVVALLTALATGLGALPFAIRRVKVSLLLGPANAIAAGVMLGAAAGLIVEGVKREVVGTSVGVLAGVLFVVLAHRAVDHQEALHVGGLRGGDARKAVMIVGVMTVHSAAEGVGVGASFGGGAAFGLLIGLAIAVHNIPEGFAISLVLVPRGVRVRSAAAWSIFSSLPQPLLAVPAFLFVEQFDRLLPAGLGFAAGAMIWMAAAELLPDALQTASRRSVALGAALAFAAMLGLQLWLI